MKKAPQSQPGLDMMLRSFRLPTCVRSWREVAGTAEKQGWSFEQFLQHLCEQEAEDRRRRKVQRLLKEAELPPSKTMGSLDLERFPLAVRRQLPVLCEGGFVERGDNVLAFGLPGRGKTHLICAIGHELVRHGRSVYFTPTFRLVQRLLAAKRDLLFEKELRKLDRFDAVILDDIGYVQQSRDEMEVLFTFLAERYERRSVMITSNLLFSEWDKIFKDPMTTAAAIDRVIHHAVVLELNGRSKRADDALANSALRAQVEQE
jgi:DNA replication protein DnaC